MNDKLKDKIKWFIFIAIVIPIMIITIVYSLIWIINHLYLVPPYIVISCLAGGWILFVGMLIFGDWKDD